MHEIGIRKYLWAICHNFMFFLMNVDLKIQFAVKIPSKITSKFEYEFSVFAYDCHFSAYLVSKVISLNICQMLEFQI